MKSKGDSFKLRWNYCRVGERGRYDQTKNFSFPDVFQTQNQPETLAYTHGEFNFSGQTSRQTKTFQPSEIAQYVTSSNSLPFSLLNFRSSFHLRCFFKLFLCLSERSLLRRKTCFLLNHETDGALSNGENFH